MIIAAVIIFVLVIVGINIVFGGMDDPVADQINVDVQTPVAPDLDNIEVITDEPEIDVDVPEDEQIYEAQVIADVEPVEVGNVDVDPVEPVEPVEIDPVEPVEVVVEEPVVVEPAPAVTPVYVFRNQRLLNEHYEKHGIEMGFTSAEAYQAAASAVITNPNSLFKIEAEDGDGVYYLEATNEFVVLSTDGYIRTYFLPSSGKAYFDRQ